MTRSIVEETDPQESEGQEVRMSSIFSLLWFFCSHLFTFITHEL